MERAITSGQQVLIPDRPRNKKIERKTTVLVNSRDRNLLSSTGTNNFRYMLRRPLKDIVSIELVNAVVPAYLYNMNTGWNQLTFRESSSTYTVTIPPGSYTPTLLAAELQTQLNGISGITNTYSVSLAPRTQILTVTRTAGTARFYFLFYSGVHVDQLDEVGVNITSINCPARFLGFGFADYADTAGVIHAPAPMDTENFLTRIYLHVNAESNTELNRMEMSAGRHDCFHMFCLTPSETNYIFCNKDTEMAMPIYYSFPAPISRMTFLDISLRDEFYRLLDLGNREVNLVFEITHLE